MGKRITEVSLDWRNCSKCGGFKPWTDFALNNVHCTWRASSCLECNKKTKSVKKYHQKKDDSTWKRWPVIPIEINNWEWEIVHCGLWPMPWINFVTNTQKEGEIIY